MKNGTKINKSFEKWHYGEVCEVFGLISKENFAPLDDWLSVSGEIPAEIKPFIEERRLELKKFARSWNETELMAWFISPLILTLHFSNGERKIQIFSQRSLAIEHPAYEVGGTVDWMLARVRSDLEPESPYFFIHEYKRFRVKDADPLGQLLIAMVAAQKLNGEEKPVYGAYVVGSGWKFVLLDGNAYAESRIFDAADSGELTHIWLILDKTKKLVYERVDAENAKGFSPKGILN